MLFSAFLKPSFYLSCWLYASVRSEKESVAVSGHRASVVEPPWFVESERDWCLQFSWLLSCCASATYKLGSITFGIGDIEVVSSASILWRRCRSS